MAKYFLFADVLGFTSLATNLNHESLDERLDEWTSMVELIQQGTDILRAEMVSDSILAMEDDSEACLDRLMKFAQLLLEQGVRNSLPIRGAIVRGDVTWNRSLYGRAVIDAVNIEKSQDWIGVACQPGLSVDWSWDLVCVYPIPRKTGMVQLAPAIIWNIPEREQLIRNCTGQDLMKKGEHLSWNVYSKLRNTLAFSSYVRDAKELALDPKSFGVPIGLF